MYCKIVTLCLRSLMIVFNFPAQGEKVCSGQILPNLLDYISENEKHPSPEECGGVDYAAIYRALADLMQGDVPQKLNPASRYT